MNVGVMALVRGLMGVACCITFLALSFRIGKASTFAVSFSAVQRAYAFGSRTLKELFRS